MTLVVPATSTPAARSPTARGVRSRWATGLFVALALAAMLGFVALGVWQLERRIWKLSLIAQVTQRLQAAPEAMPPPGRWGAITAGDAYRRVAVTGQFLRDRETLVQAVTERGPGFWVMTPLRTAQGPIVLVNRGFVPSERRDPASRPPGDASSTVSVSGLLRISEPGGGFLRTNDPQGGRWFSRDVAAIAAAQRLGDVAPFFIDADAQPGMAGEPIGGLTIVTFRNNHLVYALTWFSLALMAGAAAGYVVRDGWRRRQRTY